MYPLIDYITITSIALLLLTTSIFLLTQVPNDPIKFKLREMTVGEITIMVLMVSVPVLHIISAVFLTAVTLVSGTDIIIHWIGKVWNKKPFE